MIKQEGLEYLKELGFIQVENDIKMELTIHKLKIIVDCFNDVVSVEDIENSGNEFEVVMNNCFYGKGKYDLECLIDLLKYQAGEL